MKLYGSYTSPFVRHCRIVLLETSLDYEFIELGAASDSNPSPTKKVPYFEHGELSLTDSSSIVRYVREQAGQTFLPQIEDFDRYCLVNTLMDAAINVFLLERFDGLGSAQSKYLARQGERIESGLELLEKAPLPKSPAGRDADIRLACFLAWGLFRKRFSLAAFPQLTAFLERTAAWAPFAETAPPQDA